MTSVTHFVRYDQLRVSPLCGEFAKSPSWTTDHDGVTCPGCLERLRAAADEQRRGGEPPKDGAP